MAVRADFDAPVQVLRGAIAAGVYGAPASRPESFVSHLSPKSRRLPGDDDKHAARPVVATPVEDTTTPGEDATARHAAATRRALRTAVTRVEAVGASFSARRTFTARQVAGFVVVAGGVAVALALWPVATIVGLELCAAAFFFAVCFVRCFAATTIARREPPCLPRRIRNPPVYTLLVPLRDEAHMIPQIVAALDRLRWPRERLDIKLVIDADDHATLAAARAIAAAPPYEVIEVPPGGPRTKPMALQYALCFARGALVTVYDAEDRPHPLQLVEAYMAFCGDGPDLACLQAPLAIDNAGCNALAALFAIEYAALFDGLLPALVKLRLPLPLGGTSNHFRGLR